MKFHTSWQFLLQVFIVIAVISSQCSSTSSNLVASTTEKNCEKLPKIAKYKLLECCAIPSLFKSDIKNKCVTECPDSKPNPWCCMTKCTMEESGIATNGTIDKTQANKVFKSLFSHSADTIKRAEEIVDKCDGDNSPSNDPQNQDCEHPEYAHFLTCIHHEFLRACIRNTTDATCKRLKNFIKKCPAKRDLLFES